MNQILKFVQLNFHLTSMQNSVSSKSKWKTFFKKNKTTLHSEQKAEDVVVNSIVQTECNQSKQPNDQPQIKEQVKNFESNEEIQRCVVKQTDKSKQSQQQNSEETKSQQSKKKRPDIEAKEQISSPTKKILSILELKQNQKAKQNQQKQQQSHKQRQQSTTNLQPSNNKPTPIYPQQQKPQKNKSKLVRGHYKIFNPQHFDVKNEQIKTSIHRWTYGTGQTPSKLLICSWNVNGIRARMANNDILPYIEFEKPDIFCMNQTKLDEKSYLDSPCKFWGYYSYWNFPKYSLGYSGVAVFSKYPAIQIFEDINVPQHSKEGRVITLEFDKFVLVNCYIPTCGRELERLEYRVKQYDPAFIQYIIQTKTKFPNKTIIICGDLNVAHGQLDCHTGKRMLEGKQPAFTFQERKSFSTLMKETNTFDTFRHFYPNQRKYTWWNMRRGGRERAGETGIGKRLDYFLVDRGSMKYVKSSEIKNHVKGCDHCPIELVVDFNF